MSAAIGPDATLPTRELTSAFMLSGEPQRWASGPGLYISSLGQKQCLNLKALFIREDGFWHDYDSNLTLL